MNGLFTGDGLVLVFPPKPQGCGRQPRHFCPYEWEMHFQVRFSPQVEIAASTHPRECLSGLPSPGGLFRCGTREPRAAEKFGGAVAPADGQGLPIRVVSDNSVFCRLSERSRFLSKDAKKINEEQTERGVLAAIFLTAETAALVWVPQRGHPED